MKRRAVSTVLVLLMLSTSMAGILNYMDKEVKVVDVARATGGNNQGEYQPIIDYYWVWHRTKDLSDIVKNQSIPDHDKGRSFGSGGEQNASKMIERWMNETLGSENVKRDEINETWKLSDIPGWAWRWVWLNKAYVGLFAAVSDKSWLNRTRIIDEHWIHIRVYNKTTGELYKEFRWNYSKEGRSTCFPLLKAPHWQDRVDIDGFTYYIYDAKNITLTFKPTRKNKFCLVRFANWTDPYRSWLDGTYYPAVKFPFKYKAFLAVDEFNDTYFMSPSRFDKIAELFGENSPFKIEYPRPGFFISRNQWNKIKEYVENEDQYEVKLDIYSKWHFDDVKSYNVIGKLNGRNSSKVDIVCAHYDCWWNQGTIDEAAETALVLGIAKYMKKLEEEKGIKPEHTVKFIAFGGEEFGFRGSIDYIKKYVRSGEEKVRYVICHKSG